MVESTTAVAEPVFQAWLDVLGHFHPIAVHFPIALVMVAALAMAWNWIWKHEGYGDFAFHCVWIAALGGVLAAASGWFFADGDAKETQELFLHRWFGVGGAIALVLLAFLTSLVRSDSWPGLLKISRIGTILVAAGIGFTAHLGGDMVWGEDQVTKYFSQAISLSWHSLRGDTEKESSNSAAPGTAPATTQLKDQAPPSIDPASNPAEDPAENPAPAAPEKTAEPAPPPLLAQNDLMTIGIAIDGVAPPMIPKDLEYNKNIRPIFEARCWDCHGKGQAKGGVAFDHVGELIVKDKKKGIVVAEKPDASTLVKVVKKSMSTKGHMPPKGERLTADQIALIEAWIQQGAKVSG